MINSDTDYLSSKNESNTSTTSSSKFESLTTFIKIPDLTCCGNSNKDSIQDLKDMSFLLSIFDNIVGPKIIHYWKIESKDSFSIDDSLLNYISIHTLNGELYQDKMMGQIKYRFYLIEEVNCAIFSIFFDASTIESPNFNSLNNNQMLHKNNSNTQLSIDSLSHSNSNRNNQTLNNCLSVILPLDKKDIFLRNSENNTKFFVNIFENIIMEFKILAHIKPKVNKVTTSIYNLTQMLSSLCENIFTLNTRGILNSYDISKRDYNSTESSSILIKDTFLNDVYSMSPATTSVVINHDFLVKAISSHLITSFNTIVVGKTSSVVNKMINTLAIFMPREKLRHSCYALEDYSMLCPYFNLQGLVTENPENFNSMIEADFLFKSDYPTTIVDISSKTVSRTCISNEFVNKKADFINKKVEFLFNCLSLEDLNSIYQSASYLNWVLYNSKSNRSEIITNLIKQLDVFESDYGIKQSFVDLIVKEMYASSLNLIEYVNNEVKEKIVKLSKKKLCKDLQIQSEDDLNILISIANYLKPNFFQQFILVS